jgi:hypothetical protein
MEWEAKISEAVTFIAPARTAVISLEAAEVLARTVADASRWG